MIFQFQSNIIILQANIHYFIEIEKRNDTMLTIEKKCSGTLAYSFPTKEEILFFDIETTGFSPKTSALYLIGVLYYQEDSWCLKQWFANDHASEKELLTNFLSFLTNFCLLIHYNGLGFDIPFLKEKCMQHQLINESKLLDQISQIDIYKRIFPYKKKLKVKNLKQKTLESFLHIQRKDPYHGGELIKIYQKYIKQSQTRNTSETDSWMHTLLLHNEEDLTGMLEFSSILYLTDLLDGVIDFTAVSITTADNQMTITATLPSSFLCPLSYQNKGETLTIKENSLILQISSYQGELKFFYENYKDYYYLPMEDTAIHKSVATFVDKDYRQRAKRENCYQKREGIFFPIYHSCSFPLFRTDYKSTLLYFSFDEKFSPDDKWIVDYLHGYFINNSSLLLES